MISKMIYCLCVNMIFIVIIMICVLSELGKYIDEDGNPILTTQHLRSMYVDDIIDERYNKIRNYVIENAVKGKVNADFTIMCIRSYPHTICDNYNGYQEWWRRYILRNGGEIIPKNDIRSEQIKTIVIEKLQNAFPDSNITKGYKNCCNIYNITW